MKRPARDEKREERIQMEITVDAYSSEDALLHEKSYPRVGFPPLLFSCPQAPEYCCPLLSRAFLVMRKVLLFVIGWVRFLVKPRCVCERSTCVTGGTTCTFDLLGRI